MTHNFVVKFDDIGFGRLSALAGEKQISPSEIIKRAVATYTFLSSEVPAASGKKVSITSDKDEVLADIEL